MNADGKGGYETPSIEQIDADDDPSATEAGILSDTEA